MSYVYRQRHVATADITDGSWWNVNQNEFAGMFNGGLDRDNLVQNVITPAMLVSGACVKVNSSGEEGPDAAVMTSMGWQTLDSISSTATVDALLEVDWSGTHSWAGPGWSRTTSADSLTYSVDTVSFRLTTNGIVIAESGPSEDQFSEDCIALVGNIGVSSGPYTVNVEYLVAHRSYYDLSVEGLCSNTLNFNERVLLVVERRR